MNCQNTREVFPALLDRRTPATAHLDARAHLAGCPDCQREFSTLSQTLAALDAMPAPSPTSRLRQNFYAMLEEEKNSSASVREAEARKSRLPGLRSLGGAGWGWILSPVAASALLLLGFVAGQRVAPTPVPVALPVDPAAQREIADLRKKVDTLGQLVGTSLLQQQQRPANDRLRAVLTSTTLDNPNDKVLSDLVGALALDPSVNVRYSALEALYPHADQEVVRAGVLASLPREENPLMQVSMIDFLAAAQDREAAPVLEKISANASADRSVRDAARRALTQL